MIHNTDTIRKRFSSRIAPCPFFLGIARRRMWGAAPRPALAAVRLGGQSWRAAPLSCPHSSGSGRSCRVKGSPRLARVLALRAAGRSSQPGPLRALDPPSANTPSNATERPEARFSQKAWGIHGQALRSPSRGEHRKRKKSHAKALACAPKSRRAWVVGCGVRLEYSPTGRQTKRRKSVRVGSFPAFPDAIGAASMAST